MVGSFALVATVMLAQLPSPEELDPGVMPPPAGIGSAPAKKEPPIPPGALCFELGAAGAARSDTGDLDAEATAGAEFAPWRAGPMRYGFRVGALLTGASSVCDVEGVDCLFGGFYFGALARLVPLEGEAVSPWIGLAITGILSTGFESEEHALGAFELDRVSAGIDFLLPGTTTRFGVFAFRADTVFSATPPPLADGHVVMWGGGVRFELDARPPAGAP